MAIAGDELGYIFYPFDDGDKLGYAMLDVFLAGSAADVRITPTRVLFRRVTNTSDVAAAEITLHWSEASLLRVAPGLFTIYKQEDTEIEGYCLGGEFAALSNGGETGWRLTSSAPIFNLSEEGSAIAENAVLMLVDELESVLAMERARAGAEPGVFDARLVKADPRQLYAVGLVLARQAFKEIPEIMRTEHYWDEYGVLSRALQKAEQAGWWPANATLEAILPA